MIALTQRFKKVLTISPNSNCAISSDIKVRHNIDILEGKVDLVKGAFGKVKGILKSMDYKIERVLQALIDINAATGLGLLTGGVGIKRS